VIPQVDRIYFSAGIFFNFYQGHKRGTQAKVRGLLVLQGDQWITTDMGHDYFVGEVEIHPLPHPH